jgi:hypothetical protein
VDYFASASKLGKANRCLPVQLVVRGGPRKDIDQRRLDHFSK